MKFRVRLSALFMILSLTVRFVSEAYCSDVLYMDEMKVYHDDIFTFIMIDSSFKTIRMYEADIQSHHPVLSKSYYRGTFQLQNIQDDFYSISNEDIPGKTCIENMCLSYERSDSGCISVRIRLGDSSNKYKVEVKSNRTDSILSIVYPEDTELQIPIDKYGYRFSIEPYGFGNISIAGISYGFSPTIKYLRLQDIDSDFFTSSGYLEISLPFFKDEIFDLWCIDGDIIRINKRYFEEKIIWHGKEFKICDRIPNFLYH